MKATSIVLAILLSIVVPGLAFAHAGHKHVMGTVVSISATEIVVKSDDTTTKVPLSAATHYYRGSGTAKAATAADVKSGMRVVVHPGADGIAAEVHIP